VSTATEQKPSSKVAVQPWAIEADHPHNSNLSIVNLVGVKLRSAISANRTVKDARSGEYYVPKSYQSMGMLPQTPGMILSVHPEKLEWRVVDPLCEDEELCDRLAHQIQVASEGRVQKLQIRGVPMKSGSLRPDEMKTLNREMWHIVTAGEAKVVKGSLPEMKDIDALPGHYLLNPNLKTRTTQPRYEHEYDDWITNLGRVGG